MNAIDLLTRQHREVARLFDAIEDADSQDEVQGLFDELADNLAVHCEIEEQLFYPEVRANRTEDILLESLEEHLGIKRVLADMLDTDEVEDKVFEARCKVLKEQVEHHVEEEEQNLFPKVKKLFGKARLEHLGEQMEQLAEQLLDEGEPRERILGETESAPPLQ